jgi:hypothetical protein
MGVLVSLNKFEEGLITEGLKLMEENFVEMNKQIIEDGKRPLFANQYIKDVIADIHTKLNINPNQA